MIEERYEREEKEEKEQEKEEKEGGNGIIILQSQKIFKSNNKNDRRI